MKRYKLLGLAVVAALIAGVSAVRIASADTEPSTMSAITPCRLLDTRAGNPIGDHPGPLGPQETATLAVVGQHGQCDIPEGTNAVTGTVTILGPNATSFLTIFPADEAQPNSSNINWVAGQPTTANQFVVGLSTNPVGAMKVFNQNGAVNVIIDINSRYEVGGGTLPTAGTWGVIDRNTIGSPSLGLRSGPFTPEFGPLPAAPPFGTGSLALGVAAGEKGVYGDQVDFFGADFSAITALGFQVYNTTENIAAGGGFAMPNISIEIDPNLAGPPLNFSTLTFHPDVSIPGWSRYIDATSSGEWGATGIPACENDVAPCTWDALQALLNDGGEPPRILTVGVNRGTQAQAWYGAVDGLRINDTVFDFEEHGVQTVPVPAP